MKKLYPFSVGYYMANVTSFSHHNSDSEGTQAYKKLRRDMHLKENQLMSKIQDLTSDMNNLKKTIADRDRQMKDSTSLVQKMG